jgi:tRNA-splicing ligase RtcB
MSARYEILKSPNVPIKAWVKGVPVEAEALKQLRQTAALPIVHKWVAVMPDVHFGLGATVGSVVPTLRAIIPAAVGVDIGCGMVASKTSLRARDLPDNLFAMRCAIEKAVPHGRTVGSRDKGAWANPGRPQDEAWAKLSPRFACICEKHRKLKNTNNHTHLGTLGTGNHFIEVCLDEVDHVWIMLHSGSRGVGNAIGTYFIERARNEMNALGMELPNRDLAYLREGTQSFDDYVEAVEWAQDFARVNRELMMNAVIAALRSLPSLPRFRADMVAVNCHHNYVSREYHYGEHVFVTRKGAVRARKDELGIIPGSMGAKSFIVRGKGNPESFESCSHGAGRVMSRSAAKKMFTVEDQRRATEGVECRKDADVIDEIPMAYKSIDKVMEAQSDLVEIVHTLRQVVCVKG